MPTKVSIILPVYNTLDSLDRCMQSILTQTLDSIEVIIVDDGSTDGSEKLVDVYGEQDPRVHVIHQENSGVAVARNTGIAAAKGEYLAFVDSDDYAHPKLYETLYEAAREGEIDVVSCSMYRIWQDESVLVESEDRLIDLAEKARPEVIDRCIFGEYKYRISVWGKLYKKSLIDRYGIWYWGKRMGDALFNIKVLMVADTVQILSDPLYYYHKRPGSITTTTVTDHLYPIQHVSMITQIQDFAAEHSILDRIDAMLPEYYLRFLKTALIATEHGHEYPYIYSVFKKLYNEDPNFKEMMTRIKVSNRHSQTIKSRAWSAYRHIFAWACSKGLLRIAALLYWRQQKPWRSGNGS